jgi:hypothetical protein
MLLFLLIVAVIVYVLYTWTCKSKTLLGGSKKNNDKSLYGNNDKSLDGNNDKSLDCNNESDSNDSKNKLSIVMPDGIKYKVSKLVIK